MWFSSVSKEIPFYLMNARDDSAEVEKDDTVGSTVNAWRAQSSSGADSVKVSRGS
jgi:hypothetical protein